jgi:hypothetical protein
MTKNNSESVLLMSSVSGSNTSREKMHSLMKNIKTRRARLIDEDLEGCMRIATTDIKSHTEGFLKQEQYQILL